jgi:hypothetical protein
MNKPDPAGRLIQWLIELSEFDIDYRPQTTIKAQVLANFIVEFTIKDDEPKEDNEQTSRWMAYIVGSSTKNAGGIGIILKFPKGDIIKQVVRLQYTTTNNEAEYEALLTGLKLAKILGETKLDIHSRHEVITDEHVSSTFVFSSSSFQHIPAHGLDHTDLVLSRLFWILLQASRPPRATKISSIVVSIIIGSC